MNLLKRVQWTRCMPLVLIAALTAAPLAHANGGDPGGPSGSGVQPMFVDGNPSCSDLFPGSYEYKIDDPYSGYFTGGNHPDGEMEVSLTVYSNKTFDWISSNSLVGHVVVKGGPNANSYSYDPKVSSDTNLHAPVNKQGDYYGLSHISFCYEPVLPDPNLMVTKECPNPPTLIEGGTGGAVYNYNVTVKNTGTNTGDAELTNFVVTEKLDADGYASCAVTGAYAVDIDGPTLIPGLTLGEDEQKVLNVACTTDTPLDGRKNYIAIKAATGFDHEPYVDDYSEAICPENDPPVISLAKECGDPMIRLVPMDGILAVEACVDLQVTASSGNVEAVGSINLFDDLVFGEGVPEPLTGVVLQPGDSTEKMTYCYFPSEPTGPTLGGANGDSWYSVFSVIANEGDPEEALFTNTAFANGKGVFSQEVTVSNLDSADCSICVSDNPDLPAACPDPTENPFPLYLNP